MAYTIDNIISNNPARPVAYAKDMWWVPTAGQTQTVQDALTSLNGNGNGGGGTPITPMFDIDENGYWIVSTDGGQNWSSPIGKATGDNGATPSFRILGKHLWVTINGVDVDLGEISGEDGESFEMIFYRSQDAIVWTDSNNSNLLPDDTWWYDNIPQNSNWKDNAQGVTSTYIYEYYSYRYIVKSDTTHTKKGNWSTPQIWNVYRSVTIDETTRTQLIEAAEEKATQVANTAFTQLNQANTDIMNLLQYGQNNQSGVFTAAMGWNNTSTQYSQSVGTWYTTTGGVTYGNISNYLQGASGIEMRVSSLQDDVLGASKLLVGTGGIFASVSDLASVNGMTEGDLNTAQQTMKNNLIDLSVENATVLINKDRNYIDEEGRLICVYTGATITNVLDQNEAFYFEKSAQNGVCFYKKDYSDYSDKYEYELDENDQKILYVEALNTYDWDLLNNVTGAAFEQNKDRIVKTSWAVSDLSLTSDKISAIVSNKNDAAEWILSSTAFQVKAKDIVLQGSVAASSLKTEDEEGDVTIDKGEIKFEKNGHELLQVSGATVSSTSADSELKKINVGSDAFWTMSKASAIKLVTDGKHSDKTVVDFLDGGVDENYNFVGSSKLVPYTFVGSLTGPSSSITLFEYTYAINVPDVDNSYILNPFAQSNNSYFKISCKNTSNDSQWYTLEYTIDNDHKVITSSTNDNNGHTVNDMISIINSYGTKTFYLKYEFYLTLRNQTIRKIISPGPQRRTYYNDGYLIRNTYGYFGMRGDEVKLNKLVLSDSSDSNLANVQIGSNGMVVDLGNGVSVRMLKTNTNSLVELVHKEGASALEGLAINQDGLWYLDKTNYCARKISTVEIDSRLFLCAATGAPSESNPEVLSFTNF